MDHSQLKPTFDLLPGIWCIVDASSRYLYYNQAYAVLVGVSDKPIGFLYGKTVADMHCRAAECAPIFWQEDALVKSSKKMVRVLNTIQMADGLWKVLQIDKQPILNAAGEVEAIIFHLIDQSANHMLDLALSIAKETPLDKSASNGILVNISGTDERIELKPKESECLFYLSRGFSYKEIAKVQSITYRTVVDHIERLKLKFNAATTADLISKALATGYPGSVPQRFFNQQISIILA
ncbi:MAG: helix-turn-helix transcriptional regulator [Pseudomonadota bacterium]